MVRELGATLVAAALLSVLPTSVVQASEPVAKLAGINHFEVPAGGGTITVDLPVDVTRCERSPTEVTEPVVVDLDGDAPAVVALVPEVVDSDEMPFARFRVPVGSTEAYIDMTSCFDDILEAGRYRMAVAATDGPVSGTLLLPLPGEAALTGWAGGDVRFAPLPHLVADNVRPAAYSGVGELTSGGLVVGLRWRGGTGATAATSMCVEEVEESSASSLPPLPFLNPCPGQSRLDARPTAAGHVDVEQHWSVMEPGHYAVRGVDVGAGVSLPGEDGAVGLWLSAGATIDSSWGGGSWGYASDSGWPNIPSPSG